jgi:hypothetical protein
VRDRRAKLLEPVLAVQDFLVEEIMVMTVEWLALEIFVIAVSKGHGSPGQYILHPAVQA